MSFEGGQGPAEFRPVKLGPQRRRFDPLILGVVVVIAGLALAIVKPWDVGKPGVAVVPSGAPAVSPSPTASPRLALAPLTWSDVVPIVTRHEGWGIRTIAVGQTTVAGAGGATSDRFVEHWSAADSTDPTGHPAPTVTLDGQEGAVIALGVTFPPEEAPLDVRIWKRHPFQALEWMDVRPVDDVPSRGASLYVRRGEPGQPVVAWTPGQYRVDILVGDSIKRIEAEITDAQGHVPDFEPWVRDPAPSVVLEPSVLQLMPQGPFVMASDPLAGALVWPVDADAGPALDEYDAWLDVDHAVPASGPRRFVGQAYHSDVSQIGVILPANASVRGSRIKRIAPTDDTIGGLQRVVVDTSGGKSFVAFAPPGGESWTPGVYAMTVAWNDADGSHEQTWHIDLRPGPVPATPVLLAATRAWSRFVGSTGVLLGVPEPLSGTDPLGVSLVGIEPQTKAGYPGLSGSDLIGCGATVVHGRPEVIGIVDDPAKPLVPVASRILYPLADTGPLEILTAAGAVPGLTLVTPLMTAELGGPASYGFRAGTDFGAPGYTICIGFPGGG